MCFSGKVKEIDLLKIDAEGVEFEILEGAKNFLKNKKIKNIIVEVNNTKIKNFLKKYGYSFVKVQYNNYLASIKL